MDLIEIRPGIRRSSLPTKQSPTAHLTNHALDSVPSKAGHLISQGRSQIQSKVAAWQKPYLNAARYSASPMGGSSPPVKAMLTLKPSPAAVPTYKKIKNKNKKQNLRLSYFVSRNSDKKMDTETEWCTHLVRCSTPREEVAIIVAMQWQVENIRVCIEGLLRAITVVNILDKSKKKKGEGRNLTTWTNVSFYCCQENNQLNVIDVQEAVPSQYKNKRLELCTCTKTKVN